MAQTVFYLLLANEKELISDAQLETLSALPEVERLDSLRSLVGADQFQAIEDDVNSGLGTDSENVDPTVVYDDDSVALERSRNSPKRNLSIAVSVKIDAASIFHEAFFHPALHSVLQSR